LESKILTIFLHLFVIIVAPPFFVGVINRVKSIFAGRKGPPILQLYFDVFKLLRKGAVYSKSTSQVFRMVPMIVLACVIFAGVLFPFTGSGLVGFWGDAILFVYLFALARFAIISAALDTGSSFEGMGASREATFGAFAELTVFIVIITLAVITRSLSLNGIFMWDGGHFALEPATILLFLAFFFILLTENSRMPIDDPNTHLELTMIHEVMVLDYSGPDLGIVLYGASVKLFIFMAFASTLICPNTWHGPVVTTGILMIKVLIVAILIGVVESVTARIRLIKIPQSLIAAFVLSLFGLVVAVFARGVL
jgi:formate hydrogenlyase subunit 4